MVNHSVFLQTIEKWNPNKSTPPSQRKIHIDASTDSENWFFSGTNQKQQMQTNKRSIVLRKIHTPLACLTISFKLSTWTRVALRISSGPLCLAIFTRNDFISPFHTPLRQRHWLIIAWPQENNFPLILIACLLASMALVSPVRGTTPIKIKPLFKINCFPGKYISATADRPTRECILPKSQLLPELILLLFVLYRDSTQHGTHNGHRVSYLRRWRRCPCPTAVTHHNDRSRGRRQIWSMLLAMAR